MPQECLHHRGLAVLHGDVEGAETVPGGSVHGLALPDQGVDHVDVALLGSRVDTAGTEPVRHQQGNLQTYMYNTDLGTAEDILLYRTESWQCRGDR